MSSSSSSQLPPAAGRRWEASQPATSTQSMRIHNSVSCLSGRAPRYYLPVACEFATPAPAFGIVFRLPIFLFLHDLFSCAGRAKVEFASQQCRIKKSRRPHRSGPHAAPGHARITWLLHRPPLVCARHPDIAHTHLPRTPTHAAHARTHSYQFPAASLCLPVCL